MNWLRGLGLILCAGVWWQGSHSVALADEPASNNPPSVEGRSEVIRLWLDAAPEERQTFPAESENNQSEVGGRPIRLITNVTQPTLEIFRPEPAKSNGTCVIICPGGGHHVLAYDLEGTEVAEWLTTLGVTAVVLKYRVPYRRENQKHFAAVQDGQRAVSVVRRMGTQLGIDPDRVGVLGFSAGGQTAGLTAMSSGRLYSYIDENDEVSYFPSFAILIYPAYLVDEKTHQLKPEVEISSETCPMFLVHTADDPVTCFSSVRLAEGLWKAGVSAEVHVLEKGGHGYGLRETGFAVNKWPGLCEAWLRGRGLVK